MIQFHTFPSSSTAVGPALEISAPSRPTFVAFRTPYCSLLADMVPRCFSSAVQYAIVSGFLHLSQQRRPIEKSERIQPFFGSILPDRAITREKYSFALRALHVAAGARAFDGYFWWKCGADGNAEASLSNIRCSLCTRSRSKDDL